LSIVGNYGQTNQSNRQYIKMQRQEEEIHQRGSNDHQQLSEVDHQHRIIDPVYPTYQSGPLFYQFELQVLDMLGYLHHNFLNDLLIS
jgi:hypothetical protein